MARPLRLEFAGGIYHITSHGGRCEDIYLDDYDRANCWNIRTDPTFFTHIRLSSASRHE